MRLLDWLLSPYRRWRSWRRYQQRMSELRKRDPFIYR
jgi:hypothetical protein